MSKITILIVEDHPIFRFGMRALFNSQENLEVVGEVGSGEEAIEFVKHSKPDIILMDLKLPGISGFEAIRRIREIVPDIAILVITMFDDNSVFMTMKIGARGYLLKDAEPEETLKAINTISSGTAYFSKRIAERLLGYFKLQQVLTEREYEILGMIAQGLTNREIEKQLVISPNTVRNHTSSIYQKLAVSSRDEAIEFFKKTHN